MQEMYMTSYVKETTTNATTTSNSQSLFFNTLVSTGWFQKRIRAIDFTIELK